MELLPGFSVLAYSTEQRLMMLEVECDCHRGNRRTLFHPIPLLAQEWMGCMPPISHPIPLLAQEWNGVHPRDIISRPQLYTNGRCNRIAAILGRIAKAVVRTDVLFEDLGDKVASTSLSTHRLVQPAAADMWSWATLLEHTACFCVCKASFLQVFNVEEVRISIHFRCCGRP